MTPRPGPHRGGRDEGRLRGLPRPLRRQSPRASTPGSGTRVLEGGRRTSGCTEPHPARRSPRTSRRDRVPFARRRVAALEAADVVVANPTDCRWSGARGPARVPADLARVAAQAGPPGHPLGPAGLLDRLEPRRRPLGHPGVPERGQHARAAPRVRLGRARSSRPAIPRNDVLSSPRTATSGARACARSSGIADGTTAVLYTPTFRDDAVFAEAAVRARRSTSTRSPPRSAQTTSCCCALHNMVAGPSSRRPDGPVVATSPAPRRQRPLPRRRRAGHRLLVGDVRLRRDRPAASCFFTYDLERLPGRPARLLLRPRRGRTRAAGADQRGADRGAARHRRGRAPHYAERYARFRSATAHLEDGARDRRVLDLLLTPGPAAAGTR